MSSRELDAISEEQADRHLSSLLGIAYEELCELDYEINENQGSSGEGMYGYIVSFSDASNEEILKKIDGLEDGKFVYLGPETFYEQDESIYTH